MKHLVPDAIFEQHVILLGKTRSGKSSVARLCVEHLLGREDAVIIVDPKGDWWGLKSSADGKQAGFPVVIFGGEHGDVPLNARSGASVAELLATGNRSAIIDLGGWMPGDRTQFWIDFASTFFRLHRGRHYLVIDEVHNLCPKGKIMDPNAGKMLHWSNRLASEGLGKGISMIAASQRPQKVHNDFLTSCETLIALRVIHKADRDALGDWIDGCGDPEKADELISSIAQMKRGEAWVWSPEAEFGPKRIQFPMFETFDSFKARTITAGKLKGWAEVDLGEVTKKLESAVKEAEANDPAKLRAKIIDLERQIRTAAVQKVQPMAADPRVIERAVRQVEDGFRKYIGQLETRLKTMQRLMSGIATTAANASSSKIEIDPFVMPKFSGAEIPKKGTNADHSAATKKPTHSPLPRNSPTEASGLTPYQQSMLDALADLELIGKSEPSWPLVGAAAGKSSGSSTFERYAAQLRSSGFIDYPQTGKMRLTEDGRGRARQRSQPLTSEELQERALALLTPYQADILRALIAAYPHELPIEEIGSRSAKAHGSSTFERYMASLNSMELIKKTRPKTAKAADWLFLD